ncbi:MAG TPA: serine hydrolase domain-containing protein, partial [Alphaproteobacteria bacterium]|nr:serine hydrolase domain-containing protein [Alphaproteobacteria bacterium]
MAKPAANKISAAALEKVRAATEAPVASGDIPGALSLIWRKGELVQLNTSGLRDHQQKLPMTRDTIFAIASMSKPVTVATALTLVDAGKMKLDDPITKWAPEFAQMRVLKKLDGALDDTVPAARAITIEDLMTHRSGLTYPYLVPGPLGGALMQKMGFGIESTLTPDEWMKSLASLPLVSQPGERFNYGHSIDVLGFVIARVSGKPLIDTMRERLFEPIGMKDTFFWVPPEKRARRAATVFSPAPGNFQPSGVRSFTADTPPAYTSAGQGLLSTADDYLTFARMLMSGGKLNGVRVLKESTVKLMTSNHITPAQRQFASPVTNWKSQGFGYGVMIVEHSDVYSAGPGTGSDGTYGWGGAFGGWWQNDPKQE